MGRRDLATIKPQVYVDPRPASYFDRFHERARTREPDGVYRAMDHWFVGIRLPRPVRFMAKSQLFKGPFRQFVLSHCGAFPVRRGQRDEEAITTALTILQRSGVLVIYPEGGRSRSGQIGESARRGIGRLAFEAGAPVVPVAIYGSERARNWRRLQFPAVTASYGEAIHFPRDPSASPAHQHAAADRVLAAVRDLHRALEGL